MRLTLRTMLAYLDGTLEPEDAQVLRQRIEESQFAKKLMQRIRDVTVRPRLPAPKLDWRGSGPDPNTVAEYLGNTLTTERILDFEKVCLESDSYLAEVASTHQILTLVVGEPAEIDAHNRQRMYGLLLFAEEVADGMGGTLAGGPGSEIAMFEPVEESEVETEVAAVGTRKTPETPEYHRESARSPWWKYTLAAAVAKSTDLMIVHCLDPNVAGDEKNDELTLVEVEVVAILKGDRKVGKTRLGNIGLPMEAGKRYLMSSLGGNVFDTGFFAQSEQAVVELPPDFDVQLLAGKPIVEQAHEIFDARRAQVDSLIQQLQRERTILDQIMRKTSPGK